MIGMQYKITLPGDYNMEVIKDRIKNNGFKTDGFEDLKYKFYLITEKGENNNFQNSYCPLYFWKDNNGMNKFLFEGYYDNIIKSFGWQNINIGIPLITNFTRNMKGVKYLFEIIKDIKPKETLDNLKDNIKKNILDLNTEYAVIYNPDKWKYHELYFIDDLNKIKGYKGNIYNILHISKQEE